MPEYRRSILPGGTFFFTVVTYHRRKIFSTPLARDLLHAAFEDVKKRYPFTIDAICLLPDHIHCIWTLPEDDSNYSLRWGEIKRVFSKAYLAQVALQDVKSESRLNRGETTLWQRRFWEHTIRDLADYSAHVEYIHYNPVKHGLVENAGDWQWSSFHRFVALGYYPAGWGATGEKKAYLESDYGE